MDKETKKEFENLGRMIKQGFDGVDKRFGENTKQHEKMSEKLFKVEQEHEDIKSGLNKRAYTFELQDTQKRLRRCETKLNISY